MFQKEGILCPECFENFSLVEELHIHFNAVHNNYDSNALISILKKAKSTVENVLIPKTEETYKDISLNEKVISTAYYEVCDSSNFVNSGVVNDRSEEFKRLRKIRLRISAVDTSSLLIKLEKIINFQNSDSKQRREFEKSIVEWIDDDLVPMCPSCGFRFGINSPLVKTAPNEIIKSDFSSNSKSDKVRNTMFNFFWDIKLETSSILIRKKHHCRLCGSVICASCSFMLPTSEASKLLDLVDSKINQNDSMFRHSHISWKEDSQMSLDSLKLKMNSQDLEYSIRCCNNCKSLIENKWSQMKPEFDDGEITKEHEKLKSSMTDVQDLCLQYESMLNSLLSGNEEYSYEQASTLRDNIVSTSLEIDKIGKQYKSRGLTSSSKKEFMIFNAISNNCLLFLQTYFSTLKDLPAVKDIKEKVDERKRSVKHAALKEIENSRMTFTYVSKESSEKDGWAPGLTTKPVNPFDNCNVEPNISDEELELKMIAEQIENVRQYIELAQSAKRYDEVILLKQNMCDLESEYEKRYRKI